MLRKSLKHDERGGAYGLSWVSIIGIGIALFGVIGMVRPQLFAIFYEEAGWVKETVPEKVEPGTTFDSRILIQKGPSNDPATYVVNMVDSDGILVNKVQSGEISQSDWEDGTYAYTYKEWIEDIKAPDTPGDYSLEVMVTQNDAQWTGSIQGDFTVVDEPTYSLTETVKPGEADDAGGNIRVYPDGEYTQGEQVDISASPGQGWKFDHWGGYVSGSEADQTITMPAKDIEVVAYYTQDVSDNEDGGGTDGDDGTWADDKPIFKYALIAGTALFALGWIPPFRF